MEEWKADSDFNLSPLIDDLPAARFFWYDKVSEENKPRFLQLLATLYQLFITPHFIPIPPYQDCSYLKKMEQVYSRPSFSFNLTTHVINILKQADNPELEAIDDKFLGWLDITGFAELDLASQTRVQDNEKSRVWKWFQNKKRNLLLIRIIFTDRIISTANSHSSFLVLRKTKLGSVQYMYVDSHGYSIQDTSYAVQTRLKTDLQKYLVSLLGPDVLLEHVLDECPILQDYGQGGNCVQWSNLLIALFVSQPDLFDKFSGTLYKLSLYPIINVHLFSLSMFLRTLPQVGLQKYLRETIIPSLWSPEILNLCLVDDMNMRRVVGQHFGVPDCYSLRRNCTAPCVQSGRRCMYRTSSDGNTFLTPKEIAFKMLHIYAEIWNMTGHDPHSMSEEQIHEQLTFRDLVKHEEDQDLFNAEFELTDSDLELRESLMDE